MRILALYISREFLKLFGFLMVGFVSIYTIFDFIEKVDNFQEAGVPTSTMLTFFFLQIPALTSLLMPLAVLMATVITLGLMAKHNEIVAIKTAGVSIFRLSLPIMLLAIALALSSALLNEAVVPRTKEQTNYIWEVLVQKRPGPTYQKEKFWYKGRNSIYSVGFFDPYSLTLSNVVYYRFDKAFNLALRVDAKQVRYLNGQWVFYSGLSQKRLPSGGYSAASFERKIVDLPEEAADFSRMAKPSEEMGFVELARYVRKVEKEGHNSRRYRVDLQAKISFPFVCFIMALWGIALSLFREGGRALAPGVVLGLGVALVYWVGFSYARSLFGYSGVLPPVLAVWLPNGVFGLAGLWFLTSIRQ
ncbi:MAG: LPS export ABC transporter permease LptG [Desulfarculaceae bacterium]